MYDSFRRPLARRFAYVTAGILAIPVALTACGGSSGGNSDPMNPPAVDVNSSEVGVLLQSVYGNLVRDGDQRPLFERSLVDPLTAEFIGIARASGTVIDEPCPSGGTVTVVDAPPRVTMRFDACVFEASEPSPEGAFRFLIDGEARVDVLAGSYTEEVEVVGTLTATTFYTGDRHLTVVSELDFRTGNNGDFRDQYAQITHVQLNFSGNFPFGDAFEHATRLVDVNYRAVPDADYRVELEGQLSAAGTLPDGRVVDESIHFETIEALHYLEGADPGFPYQGVTQVSAMAMPTLRIRFVAEGMFIQINGGDEQFLTHAQFLSRVGG